MKILWVTAVTPAHVAGKYSDKKAIFGNWVDNSLARLLQMPDVEVAVVCPAGKEHRKFGPGEFKDAPNLRAYVIPYGKHMWLGKREQEFFREAYAEFRPDVVHIHGTEFAIGLNWIQAVGKTATMVTIQGLVSVYGRYYLGGIDHPGAYNTFRDIVRRDTLLQQQQKYYNRGVTEIKTIENVDYVGGRTQWDRDHCAAINPHARYFQCGETMRDSFYTNRWEYSKCRPHSIFISQGYYPVKGLHRVLEAMDIVRRKYPDVHLYVAGDSPIAKTPWRLSGYGKYLKTLIKRYDLKKHITFLGRINEEQMLKNYLNANLALVPSSIENSSNSLGESQLLRMPILASFVGGTPEIVKWNPDVLYRFEESEQLAPKICSIFDAGEHVQIPDFDPERYDAEQNINQLMAAYKTMIAEKR